MMQADPTLPKQPEMVEYTTFTSHGVTYGLSNKRLAGAYRFIRVGTDTDGKKISEEIAMFYGGDVQVEDFRNWLLEVFQYAIGLHAEASRGSGDTAPEEAPVADALSAQITPENSHPVVDWGPPVGLEVI